MALTVRLDPRTERALNALARRRRVSRSDIVRDALVRYEERQGADPASSRPFEMWFDVIGLVALGARDRGRTTGEQFTAMIRDKRRARRAR
jgi:Arc/MetJ-type ribon-helix-helix transcriptional regulator